MLSYGMPRPALNDFPIKKLRRLIDYNPDTGALTWRARGSFDFPIPKCREGVKKWNARHVGRPVFNANKFGYMVASVHGSPLRAHRVAWALHYGDWPADQVDHINGVRDDNRIANLRAVNNKQNSRNQRRRRTNKSGVTGVFWSDAHGKWLAQIRVNGKCKHLGRFDDFDSAVIARKSAEMRYGFHQNHGSDYADPHDFPHA